MCRGACSSLAAPGSSAATSFARSWTPNPNSRPSVWTSYAGALANLGDLPKQRHRFVQGDVCDQALDQRLLVEHEIDSIVHFAAETHVNRSIVDPEAFTRTNVLGTAAALEAARLAWRSRDDRRFHHVSTDEIYGALAAEAPAITEISPLAPNSPYAASKAGSNHLVRAYHRTYGLPLGDQQQLQHLRATAACREVRPNRASRRLAPIPIYGDGSNRRDWMYVADHCRALAAILCSGRTGETYNVGTGRSWRTWIWPGGFARCLIGSGRSTPRTTA